MADQSRQRDIFEQIQSDLYGVALTQEQLQNVYSAGTSDALMLRGRDAQDQRDNDESSLSDTDLSD